MTRRRSALLLVLVTLVAAVVPAVILAAEGGWSIPVTDEWAYSRDAFTLHTTGTFSFQGWGEMSKVGMLVLAQPFLWFFGDTMAAVHLFGAFATGVLVVASYCVVAGLAGRGRGLAAAALIGLTPQVPGLGPTFTTDVPMLAAAATSLALGCKALRTAGRARYAWLAASLVAGGLAFTTREVGAVAPAAVLGALAVQAFRRRSWPRGLPVGIAVAGAVTALLFEHWRRTVPGDQPPLGISGPYVLLASVGWTITTLGIIASPLLVGLFRAGRLQLHVGAVSAVLLGMWALDITVLLRTRSSLTPFPGLDAAASVARTSQLHPLLVALQVPAVLAGVVLVAHVDARVTAWRAGFRARPRPAGHLRPDELAVRLLVPVVALAELPVLASEWFDRYCLPLLWVAVVALLGCQRAAFPRRALVAGAVLAGVLAPIGWVFAAGVDHDHAVTWQAGRDLVRLGYAPTDVDVGIEWDGWHSPVPADGDAYFRAPAGSTVPPQIRLYAHTPCLTTTETPGSTLLTSIGYRDLFGRSRHIDVYSYRTCPGAPLTPAGN